MEVNLLTLPLSSSEEMSKLCLICWLLTVALITYCPFRSREASTFTSSAIHHLANVFYSIYLQKRDSLQHFPFFFPRPWRHSRKSPLCSLRWSAFKFPKQTKATKSQALQTRDTCAELEKEKTKQRGAESGCDMHDFADVAPSVRHRQILRNCTIKKMSAVNTSYDKHSFKWTDINAGL